jgi:crossover junction endodeoxyribonuclease RuvC
VSAMLVVGIDLSLTSTGLAAIRWGDLDAPRSTSIYTRRIQSKGRADASLYDRMDRVRDLRRRITDETGAADLVVIEGPSYAQKSAASAHDRAGLWWQIVDEVEDLYGCAVAEVPPTNRIKYATGKGNAGKDQVLAAVVKRYLDVDVTGNDVADSLILAAMGARYLGHPIETSLPQTHLDAMTKIRWPERTPA